jgi:hypothetical protein
MEAKMPWRIKLKEHSNLRMIRYISNNREVIEYIVTNADLRKIETNR